ncbi:hypothetical protein KT71_03297 [Congregibacter litoralis KT71]|uniref:Uncharacterized protein n=1 Tax=Congregibacter litoralis KT71 TaxID=314285 RepID=A4A7H1_9GAMM|nr:hypothetical protein KT71_03297 [Congregibacter litoralis KT71]
MDTPLIIIVAGATFVFFGLLTYKAWWFIRKVQNAPEGTDPSRAHGVEEAPSPREAQGEPEPDPPRQ